MRVTGGLACNAVGRDHVDHAGTLADAGTRLAITAAVVGAAALITYLVAPRDRLVVAPFAGPAATGLAASWTF